ncbi:MAG: DUF4153 domain-containing protein [Gemmatimonadales bacterium]
MRIASLIRATTDTAARFPASLLAAGAAATAATLLIHDIGQESTTWRVLAIAIFGISLATAAHLAGERAARRLPAARWALPTLALLALGALAATSRSMPDQLFAARWLTLLLLGHLIVAIAPWDPTRDTPWFWQWNRRLLERTLLATLYAATLFLGLAVALAAVDRLLGIDVPSDAYPQLFAILTLIFHPWFVLHGVPRPPDADPLAAQNDYPTGLKLFAQYVLVPLVTLYLMILTLYLARILMTQSWPSGWIGYLVSSVSVIGTLALLLVHPLRDRADERWIRGYARWYFLALLPALAMLLLAIGKRIGQYGMTEPRYALLILAVWMTGIALYFGVTRSHRIALIPVSLAAVTLLALIGPWSMTSLSRQSQISRLSAILERSPLPVAAGQALAEDDRREVVAILTYLGDVHGPSVAARAAGLDPALAIAWPDAVAVDSTLSRLGVARFSAGGTDGAERYAMFEIAAVDSLVSGGVAVAGEGRWYLDRALLRPFRIRYLDQELSFVPRAAAGEIVVYRADSVEAILPIFAALEPALVPLGSRHVDERPRTEPIVVDVVGETLRIRLIVTSASWSFAPADSLGRSAVGAVVLTPR